MIAIEKFFPIIKQNFAVYEEFLKRTKSVRAAIVSLVQASENSGYEGEAPLDCDLEGNSKFTAHASRNQPRKYGLKLFAEYFGNPPCFRFCSAGRSHLNPETGNGLPARAVPTPHFHWVDKNGILVAYQSVALLDKKQAAEISFPFANPAHLWNFGRLFSPSSPYELRNYQDWRQTISRRRRRYD